MAEPQLPGYRIAVDSIGHPRQCPAAQRQHIGPLQAVAEALGISLKHLEVGQQMVGEKDRLGSLKVGVTGDNYFPVRLGQVQEGPLKLY
ncbi:MAG: hypothetical protein DDT26_02332 [Dehalococcoidia bacterium]|nr:hypothetical protein [Chloroflexota bacterium]